MEPLGTRRFGAGRWKPTGAAGSQIRNKRHKCFNQPQELLLHKGRGEGRCAVGPLETNGINSMRHPGQKEWQPSFSFYTAGTAAGTFWEPQDPTILPPMRSQIYHTGHDISSAQQGLLVEGLSHFLCLPPQPAPLLLFNKSLLEQDHSHLEFGLYSFLSSRMTLSTVICRIRMSPCELGCPPSPPDRGRHVDFITRHCRFPPFGLPLSSFGAGCLLSASPYRPDPSDACGTHKTKFRPTEGGSRLNIMRGGLFMMQPAPPWPLPGKCSGLCSLMFRRPSVWIFPCNEPMICKQATMMMTYENRDALWVVKDKCRAFFLVYVDVVVLLLF